MNRNTGALHGKTSKWIWLSAFVLLQISSLLSIFFLYTKGTADVYLTFSIGIVLIYWLGPRMLFLMYLNALVNCYFWGHESILSWPVFAIPETLFFLISWLLFVKVSKGKFWVPDLNHLVKFLVMGIAIPLSVYMILLKYLLAYFGELDLTEIWSSIFASWLGDFMPTIIVSLPMLIYLSKPFFKLLRWTPPGEGFINPKIGKRPAAELIITFLFILLLTISIDFVKYWYVYALISLVIAVRHGFGPTALVNLFILLAVYFFPAIVFRQTANLYFSQSELVEIYMGTNLLALFSIVCGRVISDYRLAQQSIREQMEKVEKINTELDRFVYSVSHDLVAPLKSIKGLTNLLKKDQNELNSADYILRIEDSADKLDEFIHEILDYSRSSRLELTSKEIDLEKLINLNIDNHKFIQGFEHITFDLSQLEQKQIRTDEMRLKIIVNNLLSNAIKFCKDQENAEIKFSSSLHNGMLQLIIEDTGIGIPEEYQERIFEMFYRASHDQPGSGLGLFIAQEAARKLGGSISVSSREGVGSRFQVEIPQ